MNLLYTNIFERTHLRSHRTPHALWIPRFEPVLEVLSPLWLPPYPLVLPFVQLVLGSWLSHNPASFILSLPTPVCPCFSDDSSDHALLPTRKEG